MAIELPWLVLLGLSLPFILTVPLLLEHARGRDVGPRRVPDSTLDLQKKRVHTRRMARLGGHPRTQPGLTRVGVDLEVLEGSEMEGNVVTHGTLTLGEGAVLRGSGKAHGGIELGPSAKVYGNLLAGGSVTLARFSYVQGIIYATGPVTLHPGAVVRGVFTDHQVDVYTGAEILEDVIAPEGVHLVVPVRDSRAVEDLEVLNTLLAPDEFPEGGS